jgi:hypothetical protein
VNPAERREQELLERRRAFDQAARQKTLEDEAARIQLRRDTAQQADEAMRDRTASDPMSPAERARATHARNRAAGDRNR